MNPYLIEQDILRPALTHVSLVGELDLYSETYRDSKSLLSWAHEVIDLVGPRAQTKRHFSHFAAALAIWITERAQLDDTTDFWTTMPAWVKQNLLGPAYVEALDILELPNFQDVLANSNRYVQTAKIHGLLPPYAIPKLVHRVRAAVKAGWDAGDLRNDLLNSQAGIAVSVRYLMQYAPEQATDLLDRMMTAVRHPDLSPDLLPKHIANKMQSGGGDAPAVRPIALRMPWLQLEVLDDPQLEVILPLVGEGNWTVDGVSGHIAAGEQAFPAPTPPIVVRDHDDTVMTLVPGGTEVLVFSNLGRHFKTGELPKMGGLIVIPSTYSIVPSPYANLGRLGGGWRTHTAFRAAPGTYEIFDTRGTKITTVTSRSDILVEEKVLPRLQLVPTKPVYSVIPRLLADRILVVDKETGIGIRRAAGDDVVTADHEPLVSLSLKGERLGDQYEIEGLIIPGAKLEVSATTLLRDRTDSARLSLPSGWQGPSEFEVPFGITPRITVKGPEGRDYDLDVVVPSLRWTVKDGREASSPWTDDCIEDVPADLAHFELLRVHHGEAVAPVVRVFSNGRHIQALAPQGSSVSGFSFTHSYDLRSVHGLARTNAAETIEFRVTIGASEVVLVRLKTRFYSNLRKPSPWTTVTLADLKKLHPDDEMEAAHAENLEAERAARKERDRILTEQLRRASRGL